MGTMYLATRCNASSCVIFIISTHVMSWPNFSITDKFLTNLWIKICVQGYLSKVSPQGLPCVYQPDVILIAVSFLLLLLTLCLAQISAFQINF